MSFIIAGLGNPGEEYASTRHNVGRIMLDYVAKKFSFSEFKDNQKLKALVAEGTIADQKVLLVEPNNYMNRSGASLISLITSEKKAQNLIVIYDDLDLPLGTIKISFNRSSGGHRGVESIIKSIKTESFVRIRVGISPVTPTGKMKKPVGDEAVEKHIIGPFKKPELEVMKKISKDVIAAVEMIITDGHVKAMNEFNTRS